MIERLSQLVFGPSEQVYTECRRCGTAVERTTARCPRCGHEGIAEYRFD